MRVSLFKSRHVLLQYKKKFKKIFHKVFSQQSIKYYITGFKGIYYVRYCTIC